MHCTLPKPTSALCLKTHFSSPSNVTEKFLAKWRCSISHPRETEPQPGFQPPDCEIAQMGTNASASCKCKVPRAAPYQELRLVRNGICTYVYMYLCTCVCVCKCTYVYVWINTTHPLVPSESCLEVCSFRRRAGGTGFCLCGLGLVSPRGGRWQELFLSAACSVQAAALCLSSDDALPTPRTEKPKAFNTA